jgi:hypothetical protein
MAPPHGESVRAALGRGGALDVTDLARIGSLLAAQAIGYAPGGAVLAGLTGGLVFLVIVWDAILGRVTRVGYLYVLGAGIAPRTSRSTRYGLGLAIHTTLSAFFGLLYAGVLDWVGVSSLGDAAGLGFLIGLLQGAVSLVVAGWVLSRLHPLVRNGELAMPGRALTGYGRSTPVVWMIAHAAFGLTVGAVYAAAAL